MAVSAAQPAVPSSVRDELLAAEQQLFMAMDTKDRPTLEQLLADDYVLRDNPDVSRETWLTNALTLCWGERANFENVQVRLLETTAVVSLVLTSYRDPTTCGPAELRSLITDVWVRGGGAWQLAVRHSGPAGEAGLGGQFAVVPQAPPAFEGRAELLFVATGGNVSTETIGLAADATRRRGRGTTTAKTAFVRSGADGVDNAQSLALQVRHGVRVSDRVEAFGRGAYLRDAFAGIEHRVAAVGGVGFKISGAPRALAVDFGLGATTETRLGAEDERFLTSTSNVRFRWTPKPAIEIAAESAATANLQDGSDWWLASDLSVLSQVNQLLSAKLSYTVRYVNRPVPGFRRTDRTVSAALVFRVTRPADGPSR